MTKPRFGVVVYQWVRWTMSKHDPVMVSARLGRVGTLLSSRLILKIVWYCFLSVILTEVALIVQLWWTDNLWRNDFLVLYSAGAMVLHGDGAQLYDQSVLARYEQTVVGGRLAIERAMFYANPPYTALLLAPLAMLPPSAAYLIWGAIQLGLVAWALRLAWATTGDWASDERRLLCAATLAYLPLFMTILLGNLSLILLVCLWQLFLGLKRGREWAAGGWLVLGLIKPQAWVLVVVMLVATRRWRVLASAALIGGGVVLFSSLVVGWASWLAWIGHISHVQSEVIAIMWNLRAGLALWLGPSQAGLANLLSLVLLAGAVGATGWLWRGPWRPAAPATSARLALTVALGLLLAPYLYSHDAVLLTMAATLGYGVLRLSRWARPYTVFIVGAPLALVIGEAMIGAWLGRQLPILVIIGLVGWLIVAVRSADQVERADDGWSSPPARGTTQRPEG